MYQIDDKIEEFAKGFLDMVSADQQVMADKCRSTRAKLMRYAVYALDDVPRHRLIGRLNLNLIGHGTGSSHE
jgi:hypothetical protein